MKKTLSKILALAMLLSTVPVQPVSAEEEIQGYLEETAGQDTSEKMDGKILMETGKIQDGDSGEAEEQEFLTDDAIRMEALGGLEGQGTEAFAESLEGEEVKNFEGFNYKILEDGTVEITGYTGERAENLIIPDSIEGKSVSSIGDYALQNFIGELKLPEGLTKIGKCAFWNCSGFSGELKLPEGLIEIGSSAFWNCSGFSGELKLPEGLIEIGSFAFWNCSGFSGELKLPKELKVIGSQAFVGANNLTSIVVAEENENYSSYEGCLYNKELTVILSCPSGKQGELKLPEGLVEIEDYAFKDCSGLIGVDIPKGVTSIGSYTF